MAVVLGDRSRHGLRQLIAAGDKLDAAAEEAPQGSRGGQPQLSRTGQVDAEEYEGIKFHVATIPLPADAGDAEKSLATRADRRRRERVATVFRRRQGAHRRAQEGD